MIKTVESRNQTFLTIYPDLILRVYPSKFLIYSRWKILLSYLESYEKIVPENQEKLFFNERFWSHIFSWNAYSTKVKYFGKLSCFFWTFSTKQASKCFCYCFSYLFSEKSCILCSWDTNGHTNCTGTKGSCYKVHNSQ